MQLIYRWMLAVAVLGACGPGGTGAGGAARTIVVSITGEDLAREGIPYNPMPGDNQPVLVDGWSITFTRFLSTVSNLRLNQPGSDPGQQRVVGALVAQKAGPFVVDLSRVSEEEGQPLHTFERADDGSAFDTRVRYAFSFDLVPARPGAIGLGLDADGEAAKQEMESQGLSHLIEGTATRAPDGTMPFDTYPTRVDFRFALRGTVSYINCSNPDNGNDEEKNRGVQPSQDGAKRAIITLHVEHLFYDKLNVESPNLRFDPIAARARKMGDRASVTLDDLSGSMVLKLTDAQGREIPDRGSLPGYTRVSGPLGYDLNGTPGIMNLREFILYSAQSMAHLNGDGLCHIERK